VFIYSVLFFAAFKTANLPTPLRERFDLLDGPEGDILNM